MSEQTKHERFVSEETLEQIARLIEPLSNHLGTPMTLFDADGSIFSQSMQPSPCSFVAEKGEAQASTCRECCERLRNRFRDVYDVPVMEKCDAGVEIIAVPIKQERQLPTRTVKHFIGMLWLNPPSWGNGDTDMQSDQSQTHTMLTFIQSLLQQTAMRSQNLGELVSQLLEFQNELTMSYRFSNAASDNMDIDSLFQEALELIQNHIKPKEACIVVPSESAEFEEVAYSGGSPGSESKTGLFSTNIYHRIVEKTLQGMPVLINSYNGHSGTGSLDTSIKSILAMPIRTGKDVFGAIILAGKEDGEVFLADDENFVTSLTNSLGMVLKHVKLTKEVINAEKSSVEKQQEIVARVVHKMRNQLFAMRGNVRWLHDILAEEEIDKEALKAALAGIDRNYQDSSNVVSGFLRYVATAHSQNEEADVSSVVGDVAKDIRKSLKLLGKDILIAEEHSQNLPKTRIDISIFRSVIEELILNSTRHLNGDGRILLRTALASDEEVEISGAVLNGQYVTVEVSDNGPGIPDDIRSKIFNLGFSTRSMGTGLGLSLAKRDIERYKGKIVEIGKDGADFLILLPAAK